MDSMGLAYCRARAEMYAGRVARCPLVSHVEYAPRDVLRLEKTRRTDERTPDRLHYAFRYGGGQRRPNKNTGSQHGLVALLSLMGRRSTWHIHTLDSSLARIVISVAVWRSGNALVSINEVNLH